MAIKRYEEKKSVPQLLALLVATIREAGKAGAPSCCKSTRKTPSVSAGICDPSSGTSGQGECSVLNIRALRRAYNILLFGGPTHEEITEQAALEDQRIIHHRNRLSLEDAQSAALVLPCPSVISGGSDDNNDFLSNILAFVSTASLELRRERRFDPANALEGLIDHLVLRHGEQGTVSIDHILKLFKGLKGHRRESRDVDDWEIVGPCGRRVLQRLYGGCDGVAGEDLPYGADDRYSQTSRRARRTNIARQPIASFFRYGHARGCERHLGYNDVPVCLDPGDGSENAINAPPLSLSTQVPAANRFIFPNDCVLHEDSAVAQSSASTTAFAAHSGAAEAVELHTGNGRIPWYTASEFSSKRGVPDMGQPSALDGYLETVTTAPLSPADWTTCGLEDGAGGGRAAFPSTTPASGGGAPAVSARSENTVNLLGDKETAARVDKRGRRRDREEVEQGHDLDLYGALCRANVDARSSAVRELRVPLSFPDLNDNDAPDLLKATQARLAGPTHPTSCEVNDSKRNDHDLLVRFHQLSTAGDWVDLPPHGSRQQDQVSTLPHEWPTKLSVAKAGLSRGSVGSDLEAYSSTVRCMPEKRGLHPVGWEQSEANWNDPLVPKWAFESAPLVTSEGGPGCEAFELCYREHYDVSTKSPLEEDLPDTVNEVVMVHRALTALQGIPSESFQRDTEHVCVWVSGLRWGPGSQLPSAEQAWSDNVLQRVPGLSHTALLSLLGEFAYAGTWFFRVEEFGVRLSDRSAAVGQVAQALGVELRRQLATLQAEILGVSAEFTRGDRGAAGTADDDGSDPPREGSIDDGNDPDAKPRTLTSVLIRTIEVRRALRGLAEICGLTGEMKGKEGVRGIVEAFPRGASLLTYLYRTADTRAASRPAAGSGREKPMAVMEDRESALALLRSAAAPYLEMLGQWIWSGELWEEDDAFGEFPLRCRTRVSGDPGDSCRDGWRENEPWRKDGGGSFMSLAFCENGAASVPCFLEGGVLVAAARAGKLLRMLKLSSPELYGACAASPPPELALVFGLDAVRYREEVFSRLSLQRDDAGRSGARAIRSRATKQERNAGLQRRTDGMWSLGEGEKFISKAQESQLHQDHESVEKIRRLLIEGFEEDRPATATIAPDAAANELPSPTSSGGGGILSFLNPPTSKQKTFAAEALRERYRLLGEEAETRTVRARWRRERSERLLEARASLRRLYGEEVNKWNTTVLATEMSESIAYYERTVGGSGSGRNIGRSGDEAATQEGDTVEARWVEVKAVDTAVGKVIEKRAGRGVPLDPMVTSAIKSRVGEKSSQLPPARSAVAPNSSGGGGKEGQEIIPNSIFDREGGWPRAAGCQFGLSGEHQDAVKFSPVTIVEEPGGSSTGVASALGNWAGATLGGSSALAKEPPLKFSHVNIMQEPGGSSAAMAIALGADDVDRDGAGRLPACGLATSTSRRLPTEESVVSSPVTGSRSSDNVGDDYLSADHAHWSNRHMNAHAENTSDVVKLCQSKTLSSQALREGSTLGSFPAVEVTEGLEKEGSISNHDKITRYRTTSDFFAIDETAAEETDETSVTNLGERVRLRVPRKDMTHSQIPAEERQAGLERASRGIPAWSQSASPDAHVACYRDSGGSLECLSPWAGGCWGAEDALEFDSPLPLEVLVRRCVIEPVLAQCLAVDSAALAFLVRGAGVAEHLASLRSFLLGHGSDFLHDFTLRLLDGLFDGGVDWRRQSNLDAAFVASALAAGLSSQPLAETFRYEVDPAVVETDRVGLIGNPCLPTGANLECYSPVVLSFVSPILKVPWPVGVLLPTGVLHTYSSIHRCLFRHQLRMHRLRRLRLTLRELDASMDALTGRRRTVAGPRGWAREARSVSWDRGRLHWMHLFRHEMQHMADSLQTFFVERTEVEWPNLVRSLSVAEGSESSPRAAKAAGGSLAGLAAAHSRYISNMHAHMFLGPDRPGSLARAAIQELSEVLCTVGRITDGLLRMTDGSSPSCGSSWVSDQAREEAMLVPDAAFAELAASRVKFDAARRGLCEALVGVCAAGGGDRARPLLAILGYGLHVGDGSIAARSTGLFES